MEESNKSWFKENWEIIGILAIALAIRIYYFIILKSQVGWWDEMEYLNIAQRFAFHTPYIFGPVRQVLFPFIISLFYHISTSEFLPRLFVMILSMFSVFGMYLLGKEIFNKRVGLISAFLMSIFYLNLFFTFRLLVDLPSLTFFIFSAYFFYKYIKTKKNSNLYWFALMIGIGTLFKLSTAFLLVACFIFLIFTEKFKFLKRKEIWISALIFCLVLSPYILFGYKEFGSFVLTQASAHVAPENYLNGFNLLWNYLKLFPTYFSWPLLIIFILGILSLYKLFLYFDKFKQGDENLRGYLYSFLILIIPFILVSFMVNHNEDRYILAVFSGIFLISSSFIIELFDFIKSKIKFLAIILLITLLLFTAFYQVRNTDILIKDKQYSYLEVEEAGLWLKNNSEEWNVVATKSQPQIKYYSGLDTIGLPPTEEEFESSLTNNTEFFMLSVFEVHPEWAYTYPERKNLTVIQAYFDKNQKPLLAIYELK